jgi:hypothetical protein
MNATMKPGQPGAGRRAAQAHGSSPVRASAEPPAELYIINLKSSVAPLPLVTLKLPGCAGLVVFRSRKVEDGRERFRLHLGYFDTERAAQAALPQVREEYPEAWVGAAPQSDMGSLEDTSVAKFQVLAPVAAAAVAIEPPTLWPDARRPLPVPGQLAPSLYRRPPARPAAPASAASLAPAAVAVPAPAVAVPAAQQPLEMPAAAAPADAATPAARLQYFAVQLVWSRQPIDQRRTARLAIFEDYLLYRVETTRAGDRWYGLRVGFFQTAQSAKLIAQYARNTFKDVAVVPVSVRERERAAEAATIEVDGSRRGAVGMRANNASGARLAREVALDPRPDAAPARSVGTPRAR